MPNSLSLSLEFFSGRRRRLSQRSDPFAAHTRQKQHGLDLNVIMPILGSLHFVECTITKSRTAIIYYL